MGPVVGVPETLEFWDGKLAGWKRGSEGSLSWAAVPVEFWRICGGGWRRACDGMARDVILGESGELGMLRPDALGDMRR